MANYPRFCYAIKCMIKVQTVAAVVTFGVLIFSGQTALAQVPADSAVKQVNLFESAEGNFRVAFPGKPQRSVSKVPTDLGNVDLVSFLYEAISEGTLSGGLQRLSHGCDVDYFPGCVTTGSKRKLYPVVGAA